MFWGITLDVGKRYTQTVEKSFHLSMAALGFNNPTPEPVTIMVEVEKAQFALCTLQPGKIPQQTLDIAFTEGEEITFYTEGNNEVHLTGYLVEEPEPVDVDEMEDFSMDSDESASESESNESSSEEGEEDDNDETLDNPVTLQNLLVGENVADDDEASDDDWDPVKENPSPKKKTKQNKKTLKHKKTESSEKNVSNGVQNSGVVASLLLSEPLPSTDDESEDYVPTKKKKDDKSKNFEKKKGKKRKLKGSNDIKVTSPKSEKFKKFKKRTQKAGD